MLLQQVAKVSLKIFLVSGQLLFLLIQLLLPFLIREFFWLAVRVFSFFFQFLCVFRQLVSFDGQSAEFREVLFQLGLLFNVFDLIEKSLADFPQLLLGLLKIVGIRILLSRGCVEFVGNVVPQLVSEFTEAIR